MAIHPFNMALRKRLEVKINDEVDRITSGSYRDITVYREQVGYLRGLKEALDEADDIERGMT